MIDHNHPAVIRCFPDGNVDGRIVMAEMFAEIIQKALPHLTADDLRNTPAGRALMAEAWEECSDEFCKQGIVQVPDNPFKETPNE